MLHIDLPNIDEINRLSDIRSDACISIYLETTPLREQLKKSRISLGNHIRTALQKLDATDLPKKRKGELEEHLNSLLENESFWRLHAKSVAIFATPDKLYTYRLPNALQERVEVSDRFYLKPLFRGLTLSYSADILVLSENKVRYIELFENNEAIETTIPGLPSSLHEFMNTDEGTNLRGVEKLKIKHQQYVQKIYQVLRPYFANNDHPLILVAAEPLASTFRNTCTLSNLAESILFKNGDDTSIADLVHDIMPIIQQEHQKKLKQVHETLSKRKGQNRLITDISDAAKAVMQGNIETLMIDINAEVAGILAENGSIDFHGQPSAHSQDIIDEITKQAARIGSKIYAVRKEDLPAGASVLAASTRY